MTVSPGNEFITIAREMLDTDVQTTRLEHIVNGNGEVAIGAFLYDQYAPDPLAFRAVAGMRYQDGTMVFERHTGNIRTSTGQSHTHTLQLGSRDTCVGVKIMPDGTVGNIHGIIEQSMVVPPNFAMNALGGLILTDLMSAPASRDVAQRFDGENARTYRVFHAIHRPHVAKSLFWDSKLGMLLR